MEPILLESFPLTDGRLVYAKTPYLFQPEEEDNGVGIWYVIDDPVLDITIGEIHVEKLLPSLLADLRFMWEEYVLVDPETLTADAQELTRRLRHVFEDGGESGIRTHVER